MRENLRNARRAAGMTQQQTADYLHTSLRNYKGIESGSRMGSIEIWDDLEDAFGINQRVLREISTIHPDRVTSPLKRPEYQLF